MACTYRSSEEDHVKTQREGICIYTSQGDQPQKKANTLTPWYLTLDTRKKGKYFCYTNHPAKRDLWQPKQANNPHTVSPLAHPFYDPYHIINHFYSYELLDWSYLPGCKQHKDQNHVSLKYSAQRALLCWFNNETWEFFGISLTTR